MMQKPLEKIAENFSECWGPGRKFQIVVRLLVDLTENHTHHCRGSVLLISLATQEVFVMLVGTMKTLKPKGSGPEVDKVLKCASASKLLLI